ncbi:MAG: ABC transporter permease [Candidatus Auribacterota bacterium]|nr:ABC transporter permease [Candidatus Auribacterota bacterium]
MISYIVKRLLVAVPTLLGITLITFILVKSIPGDPAAGLVGERTSPEVIERNRERFGLDQPVVIQYWKFLRNVSVVKVPTVERFNVGNVTIPWISIFKRPYLGRSYYTGQPIGRMILEKLPNTIRLALGAMLVAILFGLALGILAGAYPGTIWDRLSSFLAIGGISIPVFWAGLILILVFSYYLGWFPPSGMGGGALIFLVLPAVTLGSRSAAYLARITRAGMLEVAGQDYVVTARAKGLSRRRVIFRHIFRNALIPIVTLAGLDFGSYLNGAVLTETIFSWDGVGRMAMNAILQRDYPVIIGCVMLGAVVFVTVNILVDISYAFIDPRIKYKN